MRRTGDCLDAKLELHSWKTPCMSVYDLPIISLARDAVHGLDLHSTYTPGASPASKSRLRKGVWLRKIENHGPDLSDDLASEYFILLVNYLD